MLRASATSDRSSAFGQFAQPPRRPLAPPRSPECPGRYVRTHLEMLMSSTRTSGTPMRLLRLSYDWRRLPCICGPNQNAQTWRGSVSDIFGTDSCDVSSLSRCIPLHASILSTPSAGLFGCRRHPGHKPGPAIVNHGATCLMRSPTCVVEVS